MFTFGFIHTKKLDDYSGYLALRATYIDNAHDKKNWSGILRSLREERLGCSQTVV